MTAIALQSLNFSTKILNGFFNGVKKTLQGIMFGYILARQTKANAYIERQLIHEYRREGHTVESLEAELNAQSLERLKKEFCRD